jgi:2-polyprenyl-6-methoxyphenol hydroxylase-like FAD-dependent oxidoreductase
VIVTDGPRDVTQETFQADVCVIGAGIIGMHNALQCAKRGLQVVIVDEQSERAKASYKVGESLLNFSNSFLRTVCELDEELSASFEKRGVWFTHGYEGKDSFEDKDVSEWAFQSKLPPSWQKSILGNSFGRALFQDAQIVRPEIEAAIRERVRDHERITVVDHGRVHDIELGDDDRDHVISWRSRDKQREGTVQARWAIDCSGRARFLAKRFDHAIALDDGFDTSAVWGQFSGCTDEVFDGWEFTFPDGEVTRRDYDTVHLWGDGYWIWLIRLTGDRISVGVSAHKRIAPNGCNLREVFWDIIRRYPGLDFLTEETVLDFGAYRTVQHVSDTYVSAKRYAIAGDAASIIDAYYSLGMSLALVTSWHAANILERDIKEKVLDKGYIDHVNDATLADWLLVRSMVKYKFTTAISDNRFFILDHLLDYVIFAVALPARHRITTWLTKTNGGDTSLETPELAKIRELLQRRMFLCQSLPFAVFGTHGVVKRFDEHRKVIAANAAWRRKEGIEPVGLTAIMRPHAPLPLMWRLPLAELRSRHARLTGPSLLPSWMPPLDVSDRMPPPLKLFAVAALPILGSSMTFDVLLTTAQRADRGLRRLARHGRSTIPAASPNGAAKLAGQAQAGSPVRRRHGNVRALARRNRPRAVRS